MQKWILFLTCFFILNLFVSISKATTNQACQVYFKHNSSLLTPEAILVINDNVLKIREISPNELIIIGHADRKGNSKYNQVLSEDRTQSVADYLRKSLKSEHYNIKLKSYGEYNLPYPTRDGVPEPLNRCVKILIISNQR